MSVGFQSPPLGVLVGRAAARYGSRTAVIDGSRTASFTDVERRSNALARALVALCQGPGSRVAVLMPNCLETVECDFAIAKAGMVRVPINSRLSQAEREFLLTNSETEVVVHAADMADSVAAVREQMPALRAAIAVDGPVPGALVYEDVIAAGDVRPIDPSEIGAADPAAPSYMLYTSGTTGRPKGAVSTRGGRLAAAATTLAQEQLIRPGDVMVHMASTAHGSGAKILPFFLSGAANRMERRWDPEFLLQLAVDGRATASFMVPTMVSALAEAAADTGYRAEASALRTIVYGGAPIPPARLAQALTSLGGVLVQVYGSAEAPHPLLLLDKDDHAAAENGDEGILASAGRETLFTSVRLIDTAGEEVTDPHEMGELWVSGPTVMAGYWNNPEATSEVLRDGWYRTGDVARRDGEGRYYIVDRIRDVIISGGYNVYPAEVEAVIASIPGIRDVAVFGVPDDRWGEAVRAVVSTNAGARVSAEAVIEHCRRYLAGYKKPQAVDIVEQLPIGPTGKVLRRELRAGFWEGRARQV